MSSRSFSGHFARVQERAHARHQAPGTDNVSASACVAQQKIGKAQISQ
jgi:hypothetical protein